MASFSPSHPPSPSLPKNQILATRKGVRRVQRRRFAQGPPLGRIAATRAPRKHPRKAPMHQTGPKQHTASRIVSFRRPYSCHTQKVRATGAKRASYVIRRQRGAIFGPRGRSKAAQIPPEQHIGQSPHPSASSFPQLHPPSKNGTRKGSRRV